MKTSITGHFEIDSVILPAYNHGSKFPQKKKKNGDTSIFFILMDTSQVIIALIQPVLLNYIGRSQNIYLL